MSLTLNTLTLALNELIVKHPELALVKTFFDSDGFGAAVNENDLAETFIEFLLQNDLFSDVARWTLYEELMTTKRKENLFREDSLGIALLSTMWYHNRGRPFLRAVIPPLIDRVGKTLLEVDPKKTDGSLVKRNMKKLLSATKSFLDRLYKSEDLLPQCFVAIIQGMDSDLSVRFEMGLSIINALLFLRFINPAVIFPENYKLVEEGTVNSDGRRTLVLIAKILQTLGNDGTFLSGKEPYLTPANRFIRKQRGRWNSFWLKIMTGSSEVGTQAPTENLQVTADDLISQSNQNISQDLSLPVATKQKEVITTLFNLEKQMKTWNRHKTPYGTAYLKIKKKKGEVPQMYSGYSHEVPYSVRDFYNFCQNSPEKISPNVGVSRTLESFNENLEHRYVVFKIGWPFKDRDFVTMDYADILEDESFAILCIMSVEREDMPPQKGLVRGEALEGVIIRASPDDPNKCTATVIYHVNPRGKITKIPPRLLKFTLSKASDKILKAVYHLLESEEIPRLDDSSDISEEEETI